MRSLRPLTVSVATAALAIGTLATPAAAADPLLAIVNGIPGRTVEVCIGNVEVKSTLRYGRWFQRRVDAGNRTIRFRQAAPGNCNGTVLAQRTLTGLVDDQDLTVVGTARAPKVLVFDNFGSVNDPIGSTDRWKAFRHAADVGAVVVTEEEIDYEEPDPAVLPTLWEKGDQEVDFESDSEAEIHSVAKPNDDSPFLGPKQFNLYEGRRTEIYVVGSNKRNARFVVIDRANYPL